MPQWKQPAQGGRRVHLPSIGEGAGERADDATGPGIARFEFDHSPIFFIEFDGSGPQFFNISGWKEKADDAQFPVLPLLPQ